MNCCVQSGAREPQGLVPLPASLGPIARRVAGPYDALPCSEALSDIAVRHGKAGVEGGCCDAGISRIRPLDAGGGRHRRRQNEDDERRGAREARVAGGPARTSPNRPLQESRRATGAKLMRGPSRALITQRGPLWVRAGALACRLIVDEKRPGWSAIRSHISFS
jgi:hypothetical protein